MRAPVGPRARWAGWIGRRLIDGFMIVLFVAGGLKALDVARFQEAVQTWPLVPHGLSYSLALAIANIEIAIALGWFLGLYRRAAIGAAVLGLVVSIAVFAAFIGSSEAPDCGCFGILTRYYTQVQTAEHVVVRNAVFLAALLAGTALAYFPASRGRGGSPRRGSANAAGGFTILEVIIVIALIAVLLSLASPMLNDSRGAAHRAISLSNLRQHVGVFSLYSNEYQDQFPYFVYPDATAIARCKDRIIEIEHWRSHHSWSYALADDYYGGNCHDESFYPPDFPRGIEGNSVRAGFTQYHYGCAFIARPAYWDPSTRTGPSQWGSTRQSDVTFPAAKGLFFAFYPMSIEVERMPMSRVSLPIGFVDGHALSVGILSVRSGYPYGDGRFGGGSLHYADGPRGYHTLDGVHGRDVN